MKATFTGNTPVYKTDGAAGADLIADKDYIIRPGLQATIDTGTCVQLPDFLAGFLMPRSSLCNKMGMRMANSIGLLDPDYTGSLKFVYMNHGLESVYIYKGDRIGQICVVPFIRADFQEVESLEVTKRGDGGFGSTGVK